MTKFSDEFIKKVKQHWKDNKGKPKGKETGGVHRRITTEKSFGMQDLADHFSISIGQAKRIVYLK